MHDRTGGASSYDASHEASGPQQATARGFVATQVVDATAHRAPGWANVQNGFADIPVAVKNPCLARKGCRTVACSRRENPGRSLNPIFFAANSPSASGIR